MKDLSEPKPAAAQPEPPPLFQFRIAELLALMAVFGGAAAAARRLWETSGKEQPTKWMILLAIVAAPVAVVVIVGAVCSLRRVWQRRHRTDD